ncbi:MAG: glycosyltransferase family 4 protein [Planctomycetaceae bacterium]|nr:glycosyltransferase family 4 protein [Planctomycetales bacterium]MCB9920682.1 glycosyltransferase family 4 protein [Planctomycetaceae bacterium]
MKLLIGWTEVNGYMAACWRELLADPEIELLIVAGKPGSLLANNSYCIDGFDDLPIRYLDPEQFHGRCIENIANEFKPDVICMPGWSFSGFRRLAFQKDFSNCRIVLASDNPFESSLRQRIGRFVLRRFLNRMDMVIVPGERGWQLARYFRIPETKIRRGLYGIDFQRLAPSYAERETQNSEWPRKFLFVGRINRTKGVDILLDAYQQYRRQVANPWELSLCGKGELEEQSNGIEGVTSHGFVQPEDLPRFFSSHGVFVLPSRRDAWPLVVSEACAAGLPVICSNACGSAVELVRPCYNGQIVSNNDAAELAGALRWMHSQYDSLPAMGKRSQEMASPYSAQQWANRWRTYLQEVAA